MEDEAPVSSCSAQDNQSFASSCRITFLSDFSASDEPYSDDEKVAGFIPPRVIAINFCEEALGNQSGQSRKSWVGKDTSSKSRMMARFHMFRLSGLRQMRYPPTPGTTTRLTYFQSDRSPIS
jgi:hypothetical protein